MTVDDDLGAESHVHVWWYGNPHINARRCACGRIEWILRHADDLAEKVVAYDCRPLRQR